MKKIFYLSVVASFIIVSCIQQKSAPESKIENTLKSIHLYSDSVGIDPHALWLFCERANKAIDSIGYPDAGYTLWIVQNDTNKAYRFMLEGSWPNQALYDTIHNNKLFKNIKPETKAEEDLWKALNDFVYNRFTVIK
jgi:hypothetical protein